VAGPLNAVAPSPVRNSAMAHAIGRLLGRPALLPAPAFALRLLLGERVQLLLDSQRVAPRAALAAGYVFRYSELEPALRSLLRP
jgi:NAD dependent epimerase/dehydratase family enzyme